MSRQVFSTRAPHEPRSLSDWPREIVIKGLMNSSRSCPYTWTILASAQAPRFAVPSSKFADVQLVLLPFSPLGALFLTPQVGQGSYRIHACGPGWGLIPGGQPVEQKACVGQHGVSFLFSFF